MKLICILIEAFVARKAVIRYDKLEPCIDFVFGDDFLFFLTHFWVFLKNRFIRFKRL